MDNFLLLMLCIHSSVRVSGEECNWLLSNIRGSEREWGGSRPTTPPPGRTINLRTPPPTPFVKKNSGSAHARIHFLFCKLKCDFSPLNLDFTLGRDSSRTYNNLSTTDVTEQHVNRSTLINESYAFNSTPIPHETTSSENESLALFPITSPNDFTATMHDSTPLTQSVKQTTPLIKHSTNISSVMTTNASLPSAATSSSHYFTVTSNLTDLTTADIQTRITTIGTKNTESLGTNHDQLLYILFCVPLLILACFIIYIIKRNFNRRRKHIHVTQHVSDRENDDTDEVMMFEMRHK